MKIFFIRYKKTKNILEGGELGSQKNYNVLVSLVGEQNIDTYYVYDESRKTMLTEYVKGVWFFLQNYYFRLTPRRVREIVQMAANYDVVFIDRSVFGIIAKRLKQSGYAGRIICFFHNIEAMYFAAKIPRWAPWRWLVCRCADRNDAYCCRYGDKVIALNQRDNQELRQRYHRAADVLIPVAFKDKYQKECYPSAMTGNPLQCLFLGAYFKPNCDGIEWFIRNVLPHVPAHLTIVGKGMAQLRKSDFMTSDIDIVSDAPDLVPYFEQADAMILPIFAGGGMKVKTCESLMYGKNIIATDESLMGYDVDAQKMGGRCNTAEEYIAVINDFVAHPRPRFNAYCRQLYLEKYSENAVTDRFRMVLQ